MPIITIQTTITKFYILELIGMMAFYGEVVKVVFIYGILLMPILFSAFVFRYTKTKMIMPFIKKQILNIHFILQNFLIGIYIPMLLLIIKLFYQMEI